MGNAEYVACKAVGVDDEPGITNELHIFGDTNHRMAAVRVDQEVDEIVNILCVGYPPRLEAGANAVQRACRKCERCRA